MGRRHALNATNSSQYTYHERKKDAAASGWGSEHLRLHKDSIKGFDCCSLTLQPCRNPVVTADGWLYDKEAVIKYILDKKSDYRRKLKAYEAQSSREFKQLHKNAEKDLEKQKAHFEKREQVKEYRFALFVYILHVTAVCVCVCVNVYIFGEDVGGTEMLSGQ
jgi:nitric oxide synthase-interacting protein